MRVLRETENTILSIEFELRKRRKQVQDQERRTDLTEQHKVRIAEQYSFIHSIEHLISKFRESIKANLGKTPPSDLQLEQTIIGSLLLEKQAIEITVYIKPDHFYSQQHSDIYKSIIDLVSESSPVDLRTVTHALRKSGKLDECGGPSYLAECTSRVTSTANIHYHARILMEFAIKRELIFISSEVNYQAWDDTKDAFELLNFIEQKIETVKSWPKK